MTTVSLTKTIPSSSDWYTTGGVTTITLHGIEEGNMNIKKSLIKIQRPVTKSKQSDTPNDDPTNYAVDLKRIDETIRLRGWLEDDSSNSAWEKFWKLRAMCTTGGPLSSFVFIDKTFNDSTIEAFLEEVTMIIEPDDTELEVNSGIDSARLRVEIILFLGNQK